MVFDENIHLVTRCPFCSAEYDLDGAQVIGEENDATMVYITCSECESSIVAIVAMSGLGVVSLGLVTDMTIEDTKRFTGTSQVTSDELLEVYELLEKNQRQAVKKLTANPQ
ncbi:MAG TPA: hypothetical protein VJC05_02840 [Candidatus Andersenbacteria bacterium]|nr:hypothetical protein [Candidatus Andersenbacteria bacterium]